MSWLWRQEHRPHAGWLALQEMLCGVVMSEMPANDPWIMTVQFTKSAPGDAGDLRRALEVLIDPGGTHELRGLPSGRSRMVRGTDIDGALVSVQELGDDRGVYYTLNPVRPDLGNRAAKVGDIISRRWILIDCDRRKKIDPDAMATDDEKTAAMELARHTADWLLEQGWPLPVMVDSGNGQHLLYRIDLPSDDGTRKLLRQFLRSLAARFDDDHATIDTSVHNASRIAKLPGTWVRKESNTIDRPWRVARLMFVPDVIEIVTPQQIETIAGAAPDDERHIIPMVSPDPWEIVVSSGPDRISAYCRSAMDKEIVKVLLAMPGNRNEFLNASAFALGQFVGANLLDRSEVVRQLEKAAFGCGLGKDEAQKTIESGLNAGVTQPRVLPDSVKNYSAAVPAQVGTAALPPDAKLTQGLDEVDEEDVDWIYENIMAIGFISIFAGQTSQGKSFVVCDLIARLTRGETMPFSEDRRPPCAVLMISEDPLEQMLAPRLNEMHAEKKLVRFFKWEAMAAYTLSDTDMLDRAYMECKQPILLVIDPPQNFLGKADEHKNAEVRSVLMRVVAWLQKRLAACILIMHVNKQIGKGLAALDRIMGSVAWASTSRIALGFTDDPDVDGQHIMAGIKNNLGPKAQARIYKIVKTTPKRAKIEWGALLDISADDAMNKVKKSRSANAAQWLAETFRQQLEWTSTQFWDAAKQNGVSKNAIDEARTRMDMPKPRKSMTPEGDIRWTWWVPLDWKYLTEDPLK